jgi:hypothetical protein
MSETLESLATDLLDKTLSGEVQWRLVPPTTPETYEADLEGGYSFRISKSVVGDDKYLNLDLYGPDGLELAGQANNVIKSFATLNVDQETPSVKDLEDSYGPEYMRFRLFSDLFAAACTHALRDQRVVIDKVSQLLKKRA